MTITRLKPTPARRAGGFLVPGASIVLPIIQEDESYHADAVHFDGGTWLINAALASSNNGTASWAGWLKIGSVPPGAFFEVWVVDPEDTYQSNPSFSNDDELVVYYVADATSGHQIYNDYIEAPLSVWNFFIQSVDVRAATPILTTYIGGVSVGQPPVIGTLTGSSTLLFNGLPFWVGADSFSGDEFIGDMADLWIAPGVSLLDGGGDIPLATRRKFISAGGKPVYLGANGELPTGTAPAVFLSGDAASFGTNQGTGGAFTTTGALTDAGTSPSD